jgi:phenylacetate-CoA ligase
MFTIFNEELAEVARRFRDDHRDFAAGRWDAARLEAHRVAKLKSTVDYVRANSPFYGRQLADVRTEDITSSTGAAWRAVPFTTKDDLRAAQHDILSRPLSKAWIFYETTGTTGASTPCPRDNVDSLANNTVLTVHYDTIFRQYGDDQVIGVSGPTELHAFGDTFGDVCRNLGLAVVKMWPHSPMVGFDRAVAVLRDLGVTGLFCTPGMALTLAKRLRAAGLDPRRDLRVRVLMLTGELASPELLANIGELWGARAYNALYASQEASVLGAAGEDGGLYTAPLINHYEVVDPVTGEPVAGTGDVTLGELVVTSLYQGAKPLVRYRTGDLVRLTRGDAGATLPADRLEVLGRTRDELVVGGRRISGYDLENLLLGHVRGYLDYQVVLDRDESGADRLSLRLEAAADEPPRIDPEIADHCRDVLGVEVSVGHDRFGSITGTGAMVSWKAARVVDNRSGADTDEETAAALSLASART